MPQTPERRRELRLKGSICGNGHLLTTPARKIRQLGRQRVPLCQVCDDALEAVIRDERAELLAGEGRRAQQQAERQAQQQRAEADLVRPERSWPAWATMSSEDINRLPMSERSGPWAEATGLCIEREGGVDSQDHPAGELLIFHCEKHLEERRGRLRPAKRHERRDRGLCDSCGAPSGENQQMRGTPDHELCRLAEIHNSTVARLMTQRLCQICKAGGKGLSRIIPGQAKPWEK